MAKTCAYCGENMAGRADKKFCADACRNAFHNKLNTEENNYVRNVINILRKNRRILEVLLPGEIARCSRTTLLEKGFSFDYFTSTFTNRKGDTYYYCFEYGYLALENDYFCLVRKRSFS